MIKEYVLKRHFWLFMSALALTVISVWSAMYQPQLISNVINALNEVDATGNIVPNMELVTKNGWMMIIVGIIGLISGIINTFISAKIAQNVGAQIRLDAYEKINNFGFTDIEQFTASNLVVRLTNDITQVQNFIMMSLQMILRVPLTFVWAFVLAIMVMPGLWWTIILYVIVVALVMGIAMMIMGPKFGEVQANIDSVNTTVKENLEGVRVVKSFVAEEYEETKFKKFVAKLTANFLTIGQTFSVVVPMFMLTANLVVAFAIFYVSGRAIENPELIGDLISFINYLFQIMFAVIMLGFVSMILGRAKVSIKRLDEILSADSSMQYGDANLPDEAVSIKFDNVSFTYPNSDEEILSDLNFEIKAGESIGIVGATGCGKSSLVNLIPRLYDVSKGEILLNNKPIAEFSNNSLSSHISIVLQKALLFSGTIRDNILDGNPTATDSEILEIAKDAQSYEFIMTKDGQLDSEVLERANNFSGGQKQRLSITRGLIKKPKILILDDSTSALDAKSENLVKKALNSNYKGTTMILVAQKISSVIDLDRIIVLDEGKIDAIGTHQELLLISEKYREIYDTQKASGVKKNA